MLCVACNGIRLRVAGIPWVRQIAAQCGDLLLAWCCVAQCDVQAVVAGCVIIQLRIQNRVPSMGSHTKTHHQLSNIEPICGMLNWSGFVIQDACCRMCVASCVAQAVCCKLCVASCDGRLCAACIA